MEDLNPLVVTLHCFWAVFPLISFSSEILSSPSSAADGPIYFQGCSQSEGCRQLRGVLWVCATSFCSCRQGWETGEHLHFAAAKLSETSASALILLGLRCILVCPRGHCPGRLCPLIFRPFGLKTLRACSLCFANVLSNAPDLSQLEQLLEIVLSDLLSVFR